MARQPPAITLAILGVAKSGTTSLKNYLGEHPNIVTHPQIEFGYFSAQPEWDTGYKAAYHKYFEAFDSAAPSKKTVIKNAGMYFNTTALERLRAHSPDVHVALILRDPAQRTYSSFVHEVRLGHETYQPFFPYIRNTIEAHDGDLNHKPFRVHIHRSQYDLFVEKLLAMFGPQKLTIINFSDFKQAPHKYISKLFKQIGVDHNYQPNYQTQHNESRALRSKRVAKALGAAFSENNPLKRWTRDILGPRYAYQLRQAVWRLNETDSKFPPADPDAIKWLEEYYAPSVARLEKILNENFDRTNL